jgi:hypothetical protein
MLRYWDKHVIPHIQNYTKGSFKVRRAPLIHSRTEVTA